MALGLCRAIQLAHLQSGLCTAGHHESASVVAPVKSGVGGTLTLT